MNKRNRYITKHNKTDILNKANSLVNAGVTLKRVLQQCRISYRTLLKLSRDPAWVWGNALLFNQGYKPSPLWQSRDFVQIKKEVAKRWLGLGMNVQQVAWLLGLSCRQVYRYKKHDTNKNTDIQ